MFVQRQDSIKKELVKHFSAEDFYWIDEIFSDEENEDDNRQDEKRTIEDNLPYLASTAAAIDEHVIKVREEKTDNDPPAL